MGTQQETTCHSLIAGKSTPGVAGSIRSVDPSTDQEEGPEFSFLSEGQVSAAVQAAHEAFAEYRALDPSRRAAFLENAAQKVDAQSEEIISTAMRETGLPRQRLQGELARTVNQLRLFARVAREGDHFGVRIDPALPERAPLPRPDLRQRKVPLGPVAVFGASNFPLAFSVAGGDTASALAAGCPVVFKAHNAHPATSQLVGLALSAAVAEADLPGGVFSLVYGRGNEIGQQLVKDARIKAVGFTGSRGGGTALMATAAARPQPIPVFAEMSSINPVVVLASAIASKTTRAALAEGFIGSVNGSSGQLCTSPGLMFVPAGSDGDAFIATVAHQVSMAEGATMLTPSISIARIRGESRVSSLPGVNEVGHGVEGASANAPAPSVYSAAARTFLETPALAEEVFGAHSLLVRYADLKELEALVDHLEGQLTATLHLDPEDSGDLEMARSILPALELKVGRILANGWPTGVDVGEAIVHGGPFPATSDGRSTSVGTLAIDRFMRPVAYQNLPEGLQPEVVRDANPWGVPRRVDGEYDFSG